MKKVIAFGTFDIVHPGHEFYLKKAKEHGDHLTVIIARDETVKKVKGMYPDNLEMDRLTKISNLEIADEVILGGLGDKLMIIQEIKPDVICIGYDQNSFTKNLKQELEKRGLKSKIVRIDSHKPEKYKSSKLRSRSNH